MRYFIAAMIAVLAGCTDPAPASIASHEVVCKDYGNSAEEMYCRTTFVQILAHPASYSGKKVLFQGWVTKQNSTFAIFPSRDAVDGGELHSSLSIQDGSEQLDLVAAFANVPPGHPRLLSVGGRLKLEQDSSSPRLGVIQDLQIVDP